MDKIKGLIDAPFTPFHENGEVNYEPIEAYAKLLVKNGLKGAHPINQGENSLIL